MKFLVLLLSLFFSFTAFADTPLNNTSHTETTESFQTDTITKFVEFNQLEIQSNCIQKYFNLDQLETDPDIEQSLTNYNNCLTKNVIKAIDQFCLDNSKEPENRVPYCEITLTRDLFSIQISLSNFYNNLFSINNQKDSVDIQSQIEENIYLIDYLYKTLLEQSLYEGKVSFNTIPDKLNKTFYNQFKSFSKKYLPQEKEEAILIKKQNEISDICAKQSSINKPSTSGYQFREDLVKFNTCLKKEVVKTINIFCEKHSPTSTSNCKSKLVSDIDNFQNNVMQFYFNMYNIRDNGQLGNMRPGMNIGNDLLYLYKVLLNQLLQKDISKRNPPV